MITELTTSSVALAVQELSKEKKKIDIVVGAATSRITGDACTPYGFHWAFDTHALAVGTGGALVKAGGDSWFFLTADYAFGYSLEKDTTDIVTANGGKVLGSVRVPLNSSDFSSFLLQAQSSKAKIIGLANAGLDTTNSIKQAAEFGIVSGGQKLAGLLMTLAEVNGLGLQAAQGLVLTEGFYWDRDDKSRAFGERFFKRTGRMPSMIHAGTYSATLQYLKAVKAAGTKDSDAVAKKLKELPVDDAFAQGQGAGKRPHGARPLSVRGQEAVGIEEALGLLQATRRGARRQGVPVGQGQRLPADEVMFVVPAKLGTTLSRMRKPPDDRAERAEQQHGAGQRLDGKARAALLGRLDIADHVEDAADDPDHAERGRGLIADIDRKQPQRRQEDRQPFQRVHLHAEHPLEIGIA